MSMRSVIAALLVPSFLGAQREPLRQPASVPVDLAAALASAGGLGPGTDPQILVGELPEWVATRIHVPDGTVVLGSAFMGTTVVGILQMLEGTAYPAEEMEAELAKKGWKRQELQGQVGGFRSAPVRTTPTIFPVIFCSGQQMLRLSPGSSRQGRQSWVLRVSTPTGYGSCNPQPMTGGRRQIPLPTLYNPVGAADIRDEMSPFGECMSGRPNYNNSNGTSARVRTALSPDSLVAHYGRQLRDSGWTTEGTTASFGSYWSRTDSAGKVLQARLTVATSTDNPACRAIQLMLFEIERP